MNTISKDWEKVKLMTNALCIETREFTEGKTLRVRFMCWSLCLSACFAWFKGDIKIYRDNTQNPDLSETDNNKGRRS